MAHIVYCPQKVEEDRYVVFELRSFLWFKWYRPLPDLYVDYDKLAVEEKNAETHLKRVKAEKKRAKQGIDSFIRHAFESHQGYSRGLTSNKRKSKGVDTMQWYDEPVSDKQDKPKEQRGPPRETVHGSSDRPPSNSGGNNQGNNNQKKVGGR